jgi:D-glycero-D-manno-heptose 1,7-bisphosphate phosphatase
MRKLHVSEKPLLFLDRDGTLIEERHFLTDPRQVRLLAGVPQALKRLRRSGFKVVVVSNQSGVGRGFISGSQLRHVNRRFLQLLKRQKADIDGLYWCPHAPSARCACRKPKLGMVKRAARDLGVSWKGSISVGDRPSDVKLGQRTGGLGVLVLTGYGKEWEKNSGADRVERNFKQAVQWIIRQQERKTS